ncbi:MAG: DUF502 domain-containing protein [Pseudomonadota bacterium]
MNEQVAAQPGSMGITAFIKRALLGGIVVLLPLTIIVAFFKWMFKFFTGLIQPFTDELTHLYAMPDYVGHLIVAFIIVLLCFSAGTFVSTRVGHWLWDQIDRFLGSKVPGYKAVKDIVGQLVGQGGAARGEVCLVKVMGRDIDITVTGMVTARHPDGRYTVFVPCGPNPTTGFIYHVAPELVELRPDVKVDAMMKTVIGCGVGAADVLRKR